MKRESPQLKPGEPRSRGATAAGTTFVQRFQSYREHHRDVALESLGRLTKSPLPTLMTLLVIAITCASIGTRFLTEGVMAILLLVIVSAALFHERQFGRWRIDVLDVGHGLAVLIEKEGEVLLYDTGKAWNTGSIAQQVVSPVLHRRGFRSIDVLIVSHADSDHAGGRDYIEKHFSPKK